MWARVYGDAGLTYSVGQSTMMHRSVGHATMITGRSFEVISTIEFNNCPQGGFLKGFVTDCLLLRFCNCRRSQLHVDVAVPRVGKVSLFFVRVAANGVAGFSFFFGGGKALAFSFCSSERIHAHLMVHVRLAHHNRRNKRERSSEFLLRLAHGKSLLVARPAPSAVHGRHKQVDFACEGHASRAGH